MTYENFIKSLSEAEIPDQLNEALQVLWYHRKGNWERSHEIAQEMESRDGAWLHAFLHRDEGDDWNAGYWYRRAGRSVPDIPIEKEWEMLAEYFLA